MWPRKISEPIGILFDFVYSKYLQIINAVLKTITST